MASSPAPSEASTASVGMLSSFVAKCLVLAEDLEIVALTIDEIVAAENINLYSIKAELKDLERLLQDHDIAYLAIFKICEANNLDVSEHQKMRQRFAIRCKALRNSLLKVMPHEEASSSQGSKEAGQANLKLPKIDIPIFKGNSEDWISWYRLYDSMVFKNGSLSNMEKFHFLKSKVQGEPQTMIEGIPFEASYYESAHQTIVDHYNDPLKRINRHLDTMQSCTPMMADKKQTLRNIMSVFRANITGLQILFQENDTIDPVSQFAIHTFLTKVDKGTRADWEREMSRKKRFATFKEFLEYIEGRCSAFERAGGAGASTGEKSASAGGKQAGRTCSITQGKKKSLKCYYCQGDHPLFQCAKFLELSVEDRWKAVREKNLCRKCFSSGCKQRCNATCRKCRKGHNTLLHFVAGKEPQNGDVQSNVCMLINDNDNECVIGSSIEAAERPAASQGWLGSLLHSNESLLATAIVFVLFSRNMEKTEVRVLLDSASQLNLVSLNFLRRLNVHFELERNMIGTVGNNASQSCGSTELVIYSKNLKYKQGVRFLVVDEIIDSVPNDNFSIEDWNIPKGINLADASFNVAQGVDMLLGLRFFWKILGTRKLKLGKDLPELRETKLGWIVADDRVSEELDLVDSHKSCVVKSLLNDLLYFIERFWVIEEGNVKELTFEEQECERLFLETTFKDELGRFVVRLPFKIVPEKLGQSKFLALKRFLALERRFAKDPNFKADYTKCIVDYLNQGHMKKVVSEIEGEKGYFIPHHAIIKETSTSTKLRAVFDASMKSSSGLSLNDCLMVGPVVQPDLFSILLRFRTHKFVFTADITQMYRQIRVHPDDSPYQRILWRNSPSEPVETYELCTVTFGTASAPFLATRCLKRLAELEGEKFPFAKYALENDFYVDDLLTGAESVNVAKVKQAQLVKVLEGAGFQLSKWCTNLPELVEGIPEDSIEKNFAFNFGDDRVIKTLGLLWYPIDDNFKIWVHLRDISANCTKREILSVICSIFDPLGIVSPITITAKLFMQSVWASTKVEKKKGESKTLDWNEEVSESIKFEWLEFSSNLPALKEILIPRFFFNKGIGPLELHGFCDASEKAYGAVFYIRSVGNQSSSSVLMCSKSKVAPLKKQSLPRLELCAALLLSELYEKVKLVFESRLTFEVIRLWSDSEIVLHWINSPSNRWQTFVANRVQKIQALTTDCIWDHVDSPSNPADLISRGMKPEKLKESNLWWEGPEWLLSNQPSSQKTSFIVNKRPFQLEIRNSIKPVVCVNIVKSPIFDRFSNYWSLVRTTAWIARFAWNAHWYGPTIEGLLRQFELKSAIMKLVQLSQKESFPEEVRCLIRGSDVGPKSPLSTLAPFVDVQSIIRVGGRLEKSGLGYDQIHPMVLSPNHVLTKLIIRYYHETYFHAGPSLLRSVLRRQFWILRINSAIKHCIVRCHKCIRLKADTCKEVMASLPKARVVPARPFTTTGVDYAGPFQRLEIRGRRKVPVKAYLAIFVCFATKAVHLEMVSDLTSEAFLAAFSRFVSRRGVPKDVYSDNGTTFVGANNILKRELKEFLSSNLDPISKFVSEKGCEWHFIPPYTPHFGGLWEAGVKSVKGQLKSVFAKTSFTFEQWTTVMTEIEACLNSRPLMPESSDPNELSALTPGHFLIGGPITAIPSADLSEVPANRLKYWAALRSLSQRFWKRWSREYLNTLQQRSKWRTKQSKLKIGDLVILKEDNTVPTKWPLGRITELHVGSDGLTRVVTVRIYDDVLKQSITVKRPIAKLVWLPLEEGSD